MTIKKKRIDRVAIYARYSTDGQNPKSVEDQVASCRRHLEDMKGQREPMVFSDAAISGSTMHREGLRALLAAAEGEEFDLLVMEGLDRLSRSLADCARIAEILRFHNISIWTIHEGYIGPLHIGVKGAMNEISLADMKDRVRRGHRARALAGYAITSLCYGYRVVRGVVDDKNRTVNGVREIVPEQAAVIKRIFDDYVSGQSVRSIVKALNNEGVRSPAGKIWRPNIISHTNSQKLGILSREIYKGILVYNRTRKIVHPLTGKTKYLVNPHDEWVCTPVPHLRIVSDELWNAAFERQVRTANIYQVRARRSQARPLTHLVICGACQVEKLMSSGQRYVCATNRFKNKLCKNARGTREQVILAEALKVISTAITREKDFGAVFADYFGMKDEDKHARVKRIVKLENEIRNLMGSVQDIASAKSIVDGVRSRQLDLDRLKKESRQPVETLRDHSTIKKKLRKIAKLIRRDFDEPEKMSSIHTMLVSLIAKIVLTPDPDKSRGELIDINLKEEANWIEFYKEAEHLWPEEELW